MAKTLVRKLDDTYFKAHAVEGESLAFNVMRDILRVVESDPELEAIGYEHYNPLFEHEYERQLEVFADYKELLARKLKGSKLKEVQFAYVINAGPQIAHIWRR
jgi:hypothetical protein